MANTKSAAKQARSSLRKRAVNLRRKHTLKKLEKQFRDLVHAKKIEEAKTLFPKVVSTFAKAAKGKTIHRNKASRKQARLSQLIK